MQIIKELEEVELASRSHPDRRTRRRIVVLQRDDGNYTFAEQYYYVSEYNGDAIAKGWQTLRPNGIHATAEIAEAEGRAAFSRWHALPG